MKKTMTMTKQWFVLFYIISAILIVAGITLGVLMNRHDVAQMVTVQGTVVNVKEQLDTEEQVNAIVTVTKYHLVVDCMVPDVGEKMITADEAYSTKEFASGKIGEQRTLHLDPTNFSEVVVPKFNFLFLIPLILGVLGVGATFFISRKGTEPSEKVRVVKSLNKVDI